MHAFEGRFGAVEGINAAAEHWYAEKGIDLRNSDGLSLHPLAEFELTVSEDSSHTGSNDSLFLQAPSAQEWTAYDHALDLELLGLLSQRVVTNGFGDIIDPVGSQLYLESADRQLLEIIPELWSSTRPFISRVYFVSNPDLAGASWSDINGAVLLGRNKNATPDALADNLFHEALHAKTARITRSFQDPFPPLSPAFVEIPWWRSGSERTYWDAKRVFDAFYVYAHMSLYYKARLTKFGSSEEVPFQRVAFRAAYLYNIVRQVPEPWLGQEWLDLAAWLQSRTEQPTKLSAAGKALLETDIRSFDRSAEVFTA